MKVYSGVMMNPPRSDIPRTVSQVRAIVAAPSKAVAMRSLRLSRSAFEWGFGETGNADDIAWATDHPGAWIQPLDARRDNRTVWFPMPAEVSA